MSRITGPIKPRLQATSIKPRRHRPQQAQAAKQQETADADKKKRPHPVKTEIPDVQSMQQEDRAQADEDQGSYRNFARVHAVAGTNAGTECGSQSKRIWRRLAQLYGAGSADGVDNLVEVESRDSRPQTTPMASLPLLAPRTSKVKMTR